MAKLFLKPDVANLIREALYVNNGLKSVATVEKAVIIHERTKELCRSSGLRLHRFLSKEVLNSRSTEGM